MKPMRKSCCQLALGLLFLLALPADLWAIKFWPSGEKKTDAEQYVYEEKDAEAEKKRYLVKLEQDKRKCELAIVNTKTLIGRSKNRPYLPELYLRLAELYIEKSRLAFFLRKSQQTEGSERALDQYESNMLKKQAIETYQRILSTFPDFQYTDKVLFFMAHEYYELGQVEEMLSQYRMLISKYPDSIYTPEAHLLLGDYFFNKKQDLERSTQHYQTVLKYTQSPAVAAARYKLAWCKINDLDYAGALKLFEASVSSPQAAKDLDIDTYRRVDVRLESLIDMAFCYPEVYKSAGAPEALAYFKQFAWSRPVYAAVVEKLAYRYYVKKKWAQAAPLYRELALIRQDPEKLLEYAKHIFESAQALGTYQNAEKDVAIIVRALERQVYSPHVSPSEKERLINDYEIYARDIITHLHARARRTNSTQDFTVASEAYKQYLEFFKESPAAGQMAANYAEALFSAGNYLEAGKQYEKLAPAATVDTRQRKEALYSAVISYYQALKEKDALNFYQAAYAREGLRSVGKTYTAEYPDSPNTPDVMFNVAWVSYDAGDYPLAVEDLSNFVSRYPHHKASTAAVHLIMDAFNLTENFEGMISYGKSLLGGGAIQDLKLRQEVAQIVRSAESRVVSTMTMAAMDDWENTREELIQVADGNAQSGMGEQALNVLVVTSQDQKDLPTLFDAGNKLINSFPKSPHSQTALNVLIDTSVSIGQLRLLADYLEIYCQRYPQEKSSPEFMLQAARIREGLGQFSQANQNYRRYLDANKTSAQQVDDLIFAMVDNTLQLGNDSAALNLLKTHQGRLSNTGKLRAQAQMALLNGKADRRAQSQTLTRSVIKAYRPRMGEKDPILRDLVAEVAYNDVYGRSGPYFKLRLNKGIDNTVVAQKAEQLTKLEEGYQQVMGYKSPAWALKACFRASEIHREFGDFLVSSPLPPELTAEQKEQYRNLITQKAQAYTDKAGQYMKTCVELARKWAVCDPALSGFYQSTANAQGLDNSTAGFSPSRPSSEIGAQGFGQERIAGLYRELLQSSEDHTLQYELAKAYLKTGDFRQAALIAQNALSKIADRRQLKARFLNLIGLAHLYGGDDPMAKESFTRALDSDAGMAEARVNLAGLYRHYGHPDKAAEVLNAKPHTDLDHDVVHPRIGALINEYSMQSR